MRKLVVGLGDRSYPIYIGEKILSDKKIISEMIFASKVLIVTNETVAPLYLRDIIEVLSDKQCDIVILPDGEKYKNIKRLNLIFDSLIENNHNRTTTLIALGGGVVGDMTGFAAACYQRGVAFIQIPTTLLAQVDSSVGGKTGINHRLGKNMIGAFYQPKSVIIDTQTLITLPKREFVSGLAEVIKYGLISDPDFFSWLEKNVSGILGRDKVVIQNVIEKSCENKARIVQLDEKESGVRAILNYGHTFGHAIEAWQNYSGWLHGEAVAVGMVVATTLSRNLGHITNSECERATKLIKKMGLPYQVPTEISNISFQQHMARDKKAIDKGVRLVLLKSIGCSYVEDFSTWYEIYRSIDECR